MTDSAILPAQRAALVDSSGTTTPEFYRFFRGLSVTAELPARVDDLTVRVAKLEDGYAPGAGSVVGQQSVVSQGILANGVVSLNLQGDITIAPALSFYGALNEGGKGWQTLSENFAKRDNGDDTASLDLSDLPDTGTGALLAIERDGKGRVTGTRPATITGTAGRVTVADGDAATGLPTIDLDEVPDVGGGALLRFVRDAWGRVTGTSAASTDDLTEGVSNLYFTAARVRATVLTGLSLATSAVIAATDTVLGAFGKLQAQITGNDAGTVHLSNAETITGVKTFTGIPGVALQCLSDTATGSVNLNCFRARYGPSALQSGDRISGFFYAGYNGTSYVNGAAIEAYTTEPWNGSASGTSFRFATTTNGTTGRSNRWELTNPGHWQPFTDNVYNIGSGSLRCAVIFAGTGSINTSDAREKTSVAPMTAAEMDAAADLSRAIGTYQWLAMVAAKGADTARHHVGLTVQQAIAIMRTHGLDPMRYGFICYDEWDELPEVVSSWPAQDAVLDDEGNVITPAIEAGSEVTQVYRPAGDRYSFRHDELLLFMARGLAARLDALEAK